MILSLLVFREIVQFGMEGKKYFLSVENLLELILIFASLVLMFSLYYPGCYWWQRQLSSVVLIVSWFLLLTIIGRHPKGTIQLEKCQKCI